MRLLIGLGTICAALIAATSASAGGTYTCTGSVGGTFDQFTGATINANVDVPAGAYCSMFLVTVTGNITVEGTLTGFENTFEKNLIVNGGSIVFQPCDGCGALLPNTVSGNLVISNSGGGNTVGRMDVGRNLISSNNTSSVVVVRTTVEGKMIGDSNTGGIALFDSTFDGDVTFVNNTGGVDVTQTSIAGTLNCESNNPAPTFGRFVFVHASRGQCAVT